MGFLLTSVDLGDGVDPDGCADVDVPGDGGAPGEVPVLVVGGELLGHVRLDDVNPVGEGHLARPGLRRRKMALNTAQEANSKFAKMDISNEGESRFVPFLNYCIQSALKASLWIWRSLSIGKNVTC